MVRTASSAKLDEGRLGRFWNEGFVVIPGAFTAAAVTAAIEAIVAADKNDYIEYELLFKEISAEAFDEHRQMAPLPEGCELIRTEIKSLMDRMNMHWEIAKLVFLKSTPGGADQDPHKDLPDVEIAAARKKHPETVQAGLLVAIMPETKLTVFSHCFTEADPAKRLKLNIGAGACILFRGDLVHHGAGYSMTNFKLHATLTVRGVEWKDEVTEAASTPTYKCPYCPFIAPTKEKVRHHRKRCPHHPKIDEIRARRRAVNREGMACRTCGKMFKTKNGCYHHMAAKHGKSSE